ncbi:hypothetical protein D3C74_255950 [compost metagenome]
MLEVKNNNVLIKVNNFIQNKWDTPGFHEKSYVVETLINEMLLRCEKSGSYFYWILRCITSKQEGGAM